MYKTVSKWIKAGAMDTGFSLIEKSFTWAWNCPSPLVSVINDHYLDCMGQTMYLCPTNMMDGVVLEGVEWRKLQKYKLVKV